MLKNKLSSYYYEKKYKFFFYLYRTNKKILESFFFTKFHNKNLLEYYNRNIDNFNFDKIPKTCYQTWKNKTLPSEIKYIINKNKEKNPEITFKLYDDDEMDEFIQKNFDERIVKAYKQINLGVVKSDFWSSPDFFDFKISGPWVSPRGRRVPKPLKVNKVLNFKGFGAPKH